MPNDIMLQHKQTNTHMCTHICVHIYAYKMTVHKDTKSGECKVFSLTNVTFGGLLLQVVDQ